MKIKPEHYEYMRERCAIVLNDNPDAVADYRAAGLSEKRFRWDVLRAAGLMTWVCDTLYDYANDDHIDTALRRIVKHAEAA